MPISDPAQLAAVFSPAVFKALASAEIGEAAERIDRLLEPGQSASTRLDDAFEAAHRRLISSYQSEYSFKNQIVSKLIFGRHKPSTASALLELPMRSSIADVMVLNGTSTIYEVKTDLDSFSRLSAQLRDYARHAEYVYVVVSERRAAIAQRHVAGTAGILALRQRGSLAVIRPATSNLSSLCQSDLFRLLRTSEAKSALNRLVGYVPETAPGYLRAEMQELFTHLPVEQAHATTVAALKRRGFSANDMVVESRFPHSLRALAYGTELSRVGRARLLDRLSSSVSEILASI